MQTDMHRVLRAFASASVASTAIGFLFHVAVSERLESWIAAQMRGRDVLSSRKVIIPAAITALETDIGLTILYALIRSALHSKITFCAASLAVCSCSP